LRVVRDQLLGVVVEGVVVVVVGGEMASRFAIGYSTPLMRSR
jgi:hypothetical protein